MGDDGAVSTGVKWYREKGCRLIGRTLISIRNSLAMTTTTRMTLRIVDLLTPRAVQSVCSGMSISNPIIVLRTPPVPSGLALWTAATAAPFESIDRADKIDTLTTKSK